jgi:hypothetical protein
MVNMHKSEEHHIVDFTEEPHKLKDLNEMQMVSHNGIAECIEQLIRKNKLAYEFIFRAYYLERWLGCHKRG